jgi:hypothetical protein
LLATLGTIYAFETNPGKADAPIYYSAAFSRNFLIGLESGCRGRILHGIKEGSYFTQDIKLTYQQ